jgi:uncharacterized protein (DUF1330 family)
MAAAAALPQAPFNTEICTRFDTMAVYGIIDVDIKDPEKYKEYMVRAKPVIEAAGGRYLVRGGAHKVYEGNWEPVRLVIVEFPSKEALEGFYYSDAYKEAKAIRQSCSDTNMVSVEGVE